MNKLFFLGWGFLVWLIATFIVRYAGQYLFDPTNVPLMVGLYVVTMPIISVLTYPLYAWWRLSAAERPLAALLMVLPGMLLDVDVLLFFGWVFPNIDTGADGLFGSWLLWAYGLVLLTALFPRLSVASSARQ